VKYLGDGHQHPAEPPVVSQRTEVGRGRQRRPISFPVLAFFAVLVVGTGLRLWHLSISPAWQWDEAAYYRVSVNVQHGVLSEHSVYGVPWEPFLWQPPFYFLVLSRWFSIVGASIYHARLLGVIATAAMQAVLFRLIWKIHGSAVALFAIVPVIFDGWLMYIERVSYIENVLLLIIVTGLLLYQRALEHPSWQRFAIAGASIGFAAIFKHTGAYLLLAVLLCWLVLRRAHKGHLVMLVVAITVIMTYFAVMTGLFDVPGHDWYIGQTITQVRRVLALQQSGGTLTSPGGLLHLLVAQYRFFIPSVLVALAAFTTVARRILQCYRVRNWEPAQENALLFSWLVTGIVVFGVSSLKYPQYFAVILIPAYCFIWTEVARWNWRSAWKNTVMATAVVAGLGSFLLTVPAFSVNTLAQVQQYAATQIPASGIVVTEESIGDLIQQRWCTVERATACLGHATYAITWRTYLYTSFKEGDPAFYELMNGARRIKSFSSSVGTATVWKLGQGLVKRRVGVLLAAALAAALAATLLVAAFGGRSAPTSSKTAAELGTSEWPVLGESQPVLGVDLYALSNYSAAEVEVYGQRTLAYIKNVLKANAVGIVWNLYAPSPYTDAVKVTDSTLSASNVGILTRIAIQDHLLVEYRPLVLVPSAQNQWEGLISPYPPAGWFNNYYQAELPYLRTAQQFGVSEFVTGTELQDLNSSPLWPSFFARVSQVYHGVISYSSWDGNYFGGDPDTSLQVARPELLPVKYLGMDMYWHMNLPATATTAEVAAAWEAIFGKMPPSILRRTAIDETGIPARAGAYANPEDLGAPGLRSEQVQMNWFTAACATVRQYHMRGVFFFKVDLTDNPAHPATSLSTFEGQEGAAAISECSKILG